MTSSEQPLSIQTDAETLHHVDLFAENAQDTSASLFLGDLSRFTTTNEIEDLLVPHGFDFVEVKLMKTEDGKSHGYGFVAFTSVKDAARAMTLLQGVSLHGRPLRVNTAGRHIRDVTPLNSPTPAVVNSLYVQFSSTQTETFTEEHLRTFFDVYGRVVDVCIKSSTFKINHEGKRTTSPAINVQEGYAFVHFEDTKAGMLAGITAASEERGNNVTSLKCELSRNLMKQLRVNGILPPMSSPSDNHNSSARVITPSPSNNSLSDLNRSNKSSWSMDSKLNSPARKKPFIPSSFAKHNEQYSLPVQFDFAMEQTFATEFCPVPASGSEMEPWSLPPLQPHLQMQQHAPCYYFMGYAPNPPPQGPQAPYVQQYPHDMQSYYVPMATYPHPMAAYHHPYPIHMMNDAPPMVMPCMQQQTTWSNPHHHPQPQYHLHSQLHPYQFQQQQQQSHMQHQPCYYDGGDCDTTSIITGSINSSDYFIGDCDSFQSPPTFISHTLGPYITVPAVHMSQQADGMSHTSPTFMQQEPEEEGQQQKQQQEEEDSECTMDNFPISPWPSQESLCISHKNSR